VSFFPGDTYNAACFLLIDQIRALGLEGDPVAMVPDRDSLLVAGAEDELGLRMMAELGAKGLEEAYPMSASPLILTGDGWQDWLPPAVHPVYRALHDLHLGWIGSLYARQKELLD
jgi:hypothetical protein